MSSVRRGQWQGPVLWALWGALMGFGLLGIFSIGIFVFALGLALLVPLVRSKLSGAWMALVGAASPWAAFGVAGMMSPDCTSGSATSAPSGEEQFSCDVLSSPTELLPLLLISVTVIAIGLVLFVLSRRRSRVL
jgi:hypothetical protein